MCDAPATNTTVIFVHVGKTAGTSIALNLVQSGIRGVWDLSPTCLARELCQVHCKPVTVCDLAGGGPVFIPVRDPVERAVSAFNYRHPRYGSEHVKAPHAAAELELYRCFDVIDELARALPEQTRCGSLARDSLSKPTVGFHLAMGFAFYLHNAAPLLTADRGPGGEQRRRYVLVRHDHVEEDMSVVRSWAGLPPAPPGPFPHVLSNYPSHNWTELSELGRANLVAHLAEDYKVLARLQQYAATAELISFGSHRQS